VVLASGCRASVEVQNKSAAGNPGPKASTSMDRSSQEAAEDQTLLASRSLSRLRPETSRTSPRHPHFQLGAIGASLDRRRIDTRRRQCEPLATSHIHQPGADPRPCYGYQRGSPEHLWDLTQSQSRLMHQENPADDSRFAGFPVRSRPAHSHGLSGSHPSWRVAQQIRQASIVGAVTVIPAQEYV
jgi:hypothetical protein